MQNTLINENEIYLQDIICEIVSRDPSEDDFAIYNKVSELTDIPDLSVSERILFLIQLNKAALI